MTYRKILVPVDGSDAARTALDTAFVVAGVFGSHVQGLHVRIDPTEAIPFVGEGMSGALMQELIEVTERESAVRAAAARAMFDAIRQTTGMPSIHCPATAGPSASWLEQSGREEEIVVRHGRLSDLTVLGRPSPGGEATAHLTFSMALFDTGHPVLVAGSAPQRPGAPFGERIVIAWNGSAEAARAVSAALPFLARARRVTALSVGSEDDDGGLDAFVDYLAWHGIAAGRQMMPNRSSIGDALLDVAADADLMVMGAYSHSRLRELILGGVTRHMLEKAPLPLLVAH